MLKLLRSKDDKYNKSSKLKFDNNTLKHNLINKIKLTTVILILFKF